MHVIWYSFLILFCFLLYFEWIEFMVTVLCFCFVSVVVDKRYIACNSLKDCSYEIFWHYYSLVSVHFLFLFLDMCDCLHLRIQNGTTNLTYASANHCVVYILPPNFSLHLCRRRRRRRCCCSFLRRQQTVSDATSHLHTKLYGYASCFCGYTEISSDWRRGCSTHNLLSLINISRCKIMMSWKPKMLNGEMILSEILNSISILRHIKHVAALLSKMQFWDLNCCDCVHEKLAVLIFVCRVQL